MHPDASGSRDRRRTRRCLLRNAAGLAGLGAALLAPPPVRADDGTLPPASGGSHKFTKKVAGYSDVGHGMPEICGMCHFFLDPDQCVIVEGPINPRGWCNYGATTG